MKTFIQCKTNIDEAKVFSALQVKNQFRPFLKKIKIIFGLHAVASAREDLSLDVSIITRGVSELRIQIRIRGYPQEF